MLISKLVILGTLSFLWFGFCIFLYRINRNAAWNAAYATSTSLCLLGFTVAAGVMAGTRSLYALPIAFIVIGICVVHLRAAKRQTNKRNNVNTNLLEDEHTTSNTQTFI
jgi:preprotein translocase subunit SecG